MKESEMKQGEMKQGEMKQAKVKQPADLLSMRKEIETLDSKISELLLQRYQVVEKIGTYKAEERLPIYDPKREFERMDSLRKTIETPYLNVMESTWRTIMRTSRSLQYKLFTKNKVFSRMQQRLQDMGDVLQKADKIAHYGYLNKELLTYLQARFPSTMFISAPSFQAAFRQLQEEKVDYLFLPLEDSVLGSYTEVYHLLAEEGVFIADSYRLIGPYYLLTLPGAQMADIKTIMAHPKIISDCLPFIRNMVWNVVEEQNPNALFDKITMTNQMQTATIGTRMDAEQHGLELRLPVPVQAHRQLRYILIGRKEMSLPQSKYLVLSFLLPNQPHALETCISLISDYGFNIHKLRTHYLEKETWNQKVFVELDVTDQARGKMQELLTILDAETNQFRLLGLYPEHLLDLTKK